MADHRFLDNTEEAFILANLKEFVKIWGSGNQAFFQLECKNGQAFLKFSSQLGSPADQHFTPPHGIHVQHHHPHLPRKKGQRQRERDRARAAAHRAKVDNQKDVSAASADATSTPGATASEGTPPSPALPAVPADGLPIAGVPAVAGPAQEVLDEVCPDTVYASVSDDDVGSDEMIAFRCFQCRMLHLPEAHREGNQIVNYEQC